MIYEILFMIIVFLIFLNLFLISLAPKTIVSTCSKEDARSLMLLNGYFLNLGLKKLAIQSSEYWLVNQISKEDVL